MYRTDMYVNEIVIKSCESKRTMSTGKASPSRRGSRQAGKRRQWARREEKECEKEHLNYQIIPSGNPQVAMGFPENLQLA